MFACWSGCINKLLVVYRASIKNIWWSSVNWWWFTYTGNASVVLRNHVVQVVLNSRIRYYSENLFSHEHLVKQCKLTMISAEMLTNCIPRILGGSICVLPIFPTTNLSWIKKKTAKESCAGAGWTDGWGNCDLLTSITLAVLPGIQGCEEWMNESVDVNQERIGMGD